MQEVGKDRLVAGPTHRSNTWLKESSLYDLGATGPCGHHHGAWRFLWCIVQCVSGGWSPRGRDLCTSTHRDVYALNTLEPFISSGNRNISKVSNLCLLGLFLGSYCSSSWHIGSIKPGVWVCLQCEQQLGRSDVYSNLIQSICESSVTVGMIQQWPKLDPFHIFFVVFLAFE